MVELDRTGITLFSSRILSKAIGFGSVIFFARELGAATLGVYFAFHTVVNVLSVFSEFGVPGAVVKRLSQSDAGDQRAAYLGGAVVLSAGIFAVTTAFVLLLRPKLHSFTGLAGTVPLLVFALAVSNGDRLLISALRGERRVEVTAWVELLGQIIRIGLSVALVLAGFGVLALIYGLLARKFAQTIVAFALADTGFAVPSREHLTSLFGFSRYTAGMNVSNLAYNWADTFVLTVLATKEAVGVYEVAWQLSMVTVLGAQAIGIALAPTITRWHENGAFAKIESAFTDSITFALLLVVPALTGAFVLGDEILRTFYRYDAGSTVLFILIAGQVSQAVKNVTQNTLFGINQPDKVFWTNALTLGANVALNLAFVPEYGMVGAAVATFLTACVAAVSQTLYLQSYISLSVDWSTLGWQVGLALVMAAVVQASAAVISPQTVLEVGGLVGVGVVLYGSGTLANEELRRRLLDMDLW